MKSFIWIGFFILFLSVCSAEGQNDTFQNLIEDLNVGNPQNSPNFASYNNRRCLWRSP